MPCSSSYKCGGKVRRSLRDEQAIEASNSGSLPPAVACATGAALLDMRTRVSDTAVPASLPPHAWALWVRPAALDLLYTLELAMLLPPVPSLTSGRWCALLYCFSICPEGGNALKSSEELTTSFPP